MDIIEIALKKASQNNKVRFDYIDAILTDWHKKELTTPEEVNMYLKSMNTKDKEKAKKALTNQQSLEFTQSTFDNLDSLFDN
jgi:DNA replication protein DnaD